MPPAGIFSLNTFWVHELYKLIARTIPYCPDICWKSSLKQIQGNTIKESMWNVWRHFYVCLVQLNPNSCLIKAKHCQMYSHSSIHQHHKIFKSKVDISGQDFVQFKKILLRVHKTAQSISLDLMKAAAKAPKFQPWYPLSPHWAKVLPMKMKLTDLECSVRRLPWIMKANFPSHHAELQFLVKDTLLSFYYNHLIYFLILKTKSKEETLWKKGLFGLRVQCIVEVLALTVVGNLQGREGCGEVWQGRKSPWHGSRKKREVKGGWG